MRPSKGFWREATSLQNCKKCSDNLVPEHRQPTEPNGKEATICHGNNPFVIWTKGHLFSLLFRYSDVLDQASMTLNLPFCWCYDYSTLDLLCSERHMSDLIRINYGG